MIISASLSDYVTSFSARSVPPTARRRSQVHFFAVPLSNARVFLDFMKFISSEISPQVAFDVGFHSDYLSSDGWVFSILEDTTEDLQNFRSFGIDSIRSSVSFFHSFYRQFRGLDDFGFYDSYVPAPIVCY